MPLPASWTLVPVVGDYTFITGDQPAGAQVIFEAPQAVVIGGQVIVPQRIVVVLDADGKIPAGTTLPSTDDPDLNVTGWAYKVIERMRGGRPPYYIFVPHTEAQIDMATVAPVAPPADMVSALSAMVIAAAQGFADQADASADAAQAAQAAAEAAAAEAAELTVLEAWEKLKATAGPLTYIYDTRKIQNFYQNMSNLPVTGSGQPIGLVKDDLHLEDGLGITKSPQFQVASHWTVPAGWSVSGYAATRVASAVTALSQVHQLIEGALYQVRIYVSELTAGTYTPQMVGTTTVSGQAISAPGEYVEWMVAPAGGSVTVQMLPTALTVGKVIEFNVIKAPLTFLWQNVSTQRPEYWNDPHSDNYPVVYYTPSIYPYQTLKTGRVGIYGTVGVLTPFAVQIYDEESPPASVPEMTMEPFIIRIGFDRLLDESECEVLRQYLLSQAPSTISEGWDGYDNASEHGEYLTGELMYGTPYDSTVEGMPFYVEYSDGTITNNVATMEQLAYGAITTPLSRTRLKFKYHVLRPDDMIYTDMDGWSGSRYVGSHNRQDYLTKTYYSIHFGVHPGMECFSTEGGTWGTTLVATEWRGRSRTKKVVNPDVKVLSISFWSAPSAATQSKAFNQFVYGDTSGIIGWRSMTNVAAASVNTPASLPSARIYIAPRHTEFFNVAKTSPNLVVLMGNGGTHNYASFSGFAENPNLVILEQYGTSFPWTQTLFYNFASKGMAYVYVPSGAAAITDIPDSMFTHRMTWCTVNGASLTALPSFAGCTKGLMQFEFMNNLVPITSWRGTTLPAKLIGSGRYVIDMTNSRLAVGVVDALLQAAVDMNLTYGVGAGEGMWRLRLYLHGTGSAVPSATGLANKATLLARGWDVKTN